MQPSDAPPPTRSLASGIPPGRVTEIQEALIKQGYLAGPPSGLYDENTAQAMKQFQVANKLPTTGMPSAHTLKRLGVAKRSNDGYAVPVKSVAEAEKKPQ
jgi:peptidoglycan hydrolase-like protein with peptidoglycan-binding domain